MPSSISEKKYILPDFSHIKGRHCGSTSLMNLQTFNLRENLPDLAFDIVSESNCFGLGSGMGFCFGVAKESPRLYLMGRCRSLTENYFSALGIPSETKEFPTPDELVKFVQQSIRNDEPVIIQSDVHFLPYYKSPQHFTGHTFLGVGLEGNELLTSDCSFPEIQRTDFESLKKAVEYPSPLFAGKNRLYLMHGPGDYSRENLEGAIYKSVRATLTEYQEDFSKAEQPGDVDKFESITMGTRALELFTKDFLRILADEPQAGMECLWLYQVSERRGTGGGNFRPMMAEYYNNIAEFLDSDSFREAGRVCGELGESWLNFAKYCRSAGLELGKKNVSKITETGGWSGIKSTTGEIYNGEMRLLEVLERIVKR